MTKREKEYAAWCAEHEPHRFYVWRRWRHVREQVLAMDRYECQLCRNKYHRYRAADTVHHVNHLRQRPELALEVYYTNPETKKKERNLLSLCHDCHEEVHGYRNRRQAQRLEVPERWD